MPLPVEKSAGKVSSLVARWQTAANKEQEQAARARHSESRRSSTSASRRSSENYSAKPSPRVEAQLALPPTGEDGVEELRDFEEKVKIDDDVKGKVADTVKGAGNGAVEKVAGAEKDDDKTATLAGETKQGQETKSAPPAEKVNGTPTKSQKGTGSAPASPQSGKKPRPSSIQSPSSNVAVGSKNNKQTPSSPSTSTAKTSATSSPTTSRIPVAARQSQAGSSSSIRSRMTSGSAAVTKPAPSDAKDVKKASTTEVSGTKSPRSDSTKAAAKSPYMTAKSTAVSTSKAPASAALASGSKATPTSSEPAKSIVKPRTTPASSVIKPKAPPSSFSHTSGSRLTPSHTGPPRPSSVNTSAGRNPVSPTPTPLRPQITGTPSKPTASSLAKAKEAAEKRKSLSLGRASGHVARQSLSKSTESTSSSKPATSAPLTKLAAPSSASRLMQGTASSRAKATTVTTAPPSPTRTKSAKSITTPSKVTPSRITPSATKHTPSKSSSSAILAGQSNGSPARGGKVVEKQASAGPEGFIETATLDDGAQTSVGEPETIQGPRLTPSTPKTSTDRRDVEISDEPAADVQAAEADVEEIKVSGNATSPTRSAIIGRVGLAGAKEAPNGVGSEQRLPTSKAGTGSIIDTEVGSASGVQNDHTSPTSHDLVNPDDVKESGEVEEPEMPRSAPSPFGRIGHPGAGSGKRELETGNANAIATSKDKEEKSGSKAEIKWNEEELKRDPAKTIEAPDSKRKEE